MSTRFTTLPSDCVQLIFDRIPSHHLLLHIRRVSRSWKQYQQLNCRGRKSLIIQKGASSIFELNNAIYIKPFIDHNIDHNGNPRNHKFFIDHNRILIPDKKRSLNPQFVISTFPHLHTLIVSTDRTLPSYIKLLTCLITSSPKLVTLQLYFEGEIKKRIQITVNNNIEKLINQLNSLSLLKNLIFHIDDLSFRIWPSIDSIEEPVFLTRINEFYFHFISLNVVMLDWMRKYDKTGRLGRLERYYLSTQTVAMDFWSSIGQIGHVPHAHLYSFSPYNEYENDEEDLQRIVARFPSLITLRHKLNDKSVDSLTKLTSILSPLTKLVHIYLKIEGNPSDEPLYPNSTAQLRSLKALDLHIDDYGRRFMPTFCQTQVQTIVQCFPNMQSIRITADDSADSAYESDYKHEEKPDLEDCANHFFDQLKVAYGRESLRTEYYNPYSRDGDD